jgi:GT2 family glycosyltransferase
LNPDTEVTAGALDKVVSLIRQDPEIGILGCRLVLRDGSFDHAAKRSFPTLIGAFGHFAGLADTASPRSRLGQYRAGQVSELGAGEVDAVNGAFMLVRREAIDQVGHLDERYPTPGLDDLDWCYRLKQSGWKVWYEGGVTVLHVKGSSTGETRGRHRYRTLRYNLAFHRALGRFYRKWYAGRYPFVDLSAYLALGGKFTISAIRSAIVRRSLR